MKEYPICFNSEMIRAILDGRKTQTRKIIKPQPTRNHYISHTQESGIGGYYGFAELTYYASLVRHIKCPYGEVGDRLWVKETFFNAFDTKESCKYKANEMDEILTNPVVWKSSRFMPRKYARITLEITDIKVEKLQEISEGEILKEGIIDFAKRKSWTSNVYEFDHLWNSLAKKGFKWQDNPWVWVISFKRLTSLS